MKVVILKADLFLFALFFFFFTAFYCSLCSRGHLGCVGCTVEIGQMLYTSGLGLLLRRLSKRKKVVGKKLIMQIRPQSALRGQLLD